MSVFQHFFFSLEFCAILRTVPRRLRKQFTCVQFFIVMNCPMCFVSAVMSDQLSEDFAVPASGKC